MCTLSHVCPITSEYRLNFVQTFFLVNNFRTIRQRYVWYVFTHICYVFFVQYVRLRLCHLQVTFVIKLTHVQVVQFVWFVCCYIQYGWYVQFTSSSVVFSCFFSFKFRLFLVYKHQCFFNASHFHVRCQRHNIYSHFLHLDVLDLDIF